MKMHYSHRLSLSQIEKIVGLFVLIPLVLVVVVAIVIGRNRELFEEKYHVTTTFKEGYGMEPGAPVVVSGIRIGQIASVRFNAENQVDVSLELLKKHREKVRLNSVATISRSGFVVGDKRILVSIGSPKLPVIENGGRLTGKDPFEIEQIIEVVMPTIENLQKMIDHLEKSTAEFPQLIETGQRSLAHVEQIAAKVGQVADELPSYAASGGRSLRNVEKVTEEAVATAQGVREMTSALPPLIEETRGLLADTQATMKNLKAATEPLPEMMRKGNEQLTEVQEIVAGVKRSWPVRNMIPPRETDVGATLGLRDTAPLPPVSDPVPSTPVQNEAR